VRPHLDKSSSVAPLAAAFSIFSRTDPIWWQMYVVIIVIMGFQL
jgi:hypothetical protein